MKEYRKSLESSHAALSVLASFWNADPANFEIRRDMAVIEMQLARARALSIGPIATNLL
jgi:hypothetical protein